MLLETIGLTKNFRTGFTRKHVKQVLQSVDFHLDYGETIGIVGDSGSGKSTLCLLLAGLLHPNSGCVMYEGSDISVMQGCLKKYYRRKVQIIFQHPETVFNPLWTIHRSMSEPFRINGSQLSMKIMMSQLGSVGLGKSVLKYYPSQLSGGELQRLAIARVLLMQPDVIILDEPTSMLDTLTQAKIMQLLSNIREKTGIAFVFVSHNLPLVHLFSDDIFMLKEGRLKPWG